MPASAKNIRDQNLASIDSARQEWCVTPTATARSLTGGVPWSGSGVVSLGSA